MLRTDDSLFNLNALHVTAIVPHLDNPDRYWVFVVAGEPIQVSKETALKLRDRIAPPAA
jgi:hypothetical protein